MRRRVVTMKVYSLKGLLLMALGLCGLLVAAVPVRTQQPTARAIPKTWDDIEIARHEIPLADPVGSPKHVSKDYYYKIPVRPIYKGYPVYAPGREPAGYLDWLRQQEPIIVWDDEGHAPPLKTEANWIRAGEVVFDA